MSRKFFALAAVGILFAVASISSAPLAVAAYAPNDPGITATEPIRHELAPVDQVAIMPAEKVDRLRVRPTVAVYNTRTCQVKTPDGSGKLRDASAGHRTFAVPWLRCRS